jgi:hypothetical protein
MLLQWSLIRQNWWCKLYETKSISLKHKPTTKVKKLLCLIVYFAMHRTLEVNRNSRQIFIAKGSLIRQNWWCKLYETKSISLKHKPTTKVKKLLCLIVYFSMHRTLEVNRNSRQIFIAKGHTDIHSTRSVHLRPRKPEI